MTGTTAMENRTYNSAAALSRIANLRRRVIEQKGGRGVEGLPPLKEDKEKTAAKTQSTPPQKVQEIN